MHRAWRRSSRDGETSSRTRKESCPSAPTGLSFVRSEKRERLASSTCATDRTVFTVEEDRSQLTDTLPAGPERRGIVISRGHRVHLRTLTLPDLELLTEWVDDPFIER